MKKTDEILGNLMKELKEAEKMDAIEEIKVNKVTSGGGFTTLVCCN